MLPLPNLEESLDADHEEDAPLHFRAVDNVVGSESPPGLAERDLGEGLMLAVSAQEPIYLAKA